MVSFSNPLLTDLGYLLKGISESCYVGKDARYSADFEEIENLLSSTASLYVNATTDWVKVIKLSEKILATESKDLRVLAWLAWGMYKTHSFAGLHAGIVTINKIIEISWDDIFPKKDRTRISTIEWLTSKVESLFEEVFSVKNQLPLFTALLAELEKLDKFLTSKWHDKAPLLLPICRRLERMVNESEKTADAEPKEGAVERVINQVKEVVSNTIGIGPASIESEKEASKLLRDLQDNGRVLCNWWLGQKSADIKALRLNRTLLWLAIDTLPDNKDYLTTLRPIPVDKINNYKERLKQGGFSDLIIDVENSIAKAPFWLDGHYFIWLCLQALQVSAAMFEVEIQLALFLEKLPDVVRLKFFDGTPFASEDTVRWINTHVLPLTDKQQIKLSTDNLVVKKSKSHSWDEVLAECIGNLAKVGFREASNELIKNLKGAVSPRERFFWKLAISKLCLADKKYDLAKTQLENLDDYVHQLGIHKWEPELELEIVCLLYDCCKAMPQSQLIREGKEKLYKRLCFLDMDLILDD